MTRASDPTTGEATDVKRSLRQVHRQSHICDSKRSWSWARHQDDSYPASLRFSIFQSFNSSTLHVSIFPHRHFNVQSFTCSSAHVLRGIFNFQFHFVKIEGFKSTSDLPPPLPPLFSLFPLPLPLPLPPNHKSALVKGSFGTTHFPGGTFFLRSYKEANSRIAVCLGGVTLVKGSP